MGTMPVVLCSLQLRKLSYDLTSLRCETIPTNWYVSYHQFLVCEPHDVNHGTKNEKLNLFAAILFDQTEILV